MRGKWSSWGALAIVGGCLVVVSGVGLWGGCGSKESVVARAGDWRLTRAQLAAEYDRIYGPNAFDRAEPARREKFLATAVHKKLLLDLARRALPQLSAAGERRIRVGAEERLLPAYRQALWRSWKPDPLRVARAREQLAREAHVQVISVGRQVVADTCAAALRSGLSFDAAWQRFGRRWRDLEGMDQGWHDPLWFPPRVMRAVFMDDIAPGDRTDPVNTRRGIWITKVIEYRPFDLNARQGYAPRVDALLQRMLYRDARDAARDSLAQALGYRLFPEACPPVGEAIQAYLDSVTAARPPGASPEQWSLRAPVWRLSPADRDRPLATLQGQTLTAADFMRTLDAIDVRHWPHTGPAERLVRQTDDRMIRRILEIDAERRGIASGAEHQQAVQRLHDEVWLDEYHDRVLMPEIPVPAAEVDSLCAAAPDRWVVPERIEFGAVFFPEEDTDEAEDFLRSARGADGTRWTELATAEAATAERAHFVATSDMLDVGRVPDPPSWEPILKFAETMSVGEVAGPVRVPEQEAVAVVRLITRLPAQPMPPGAAHAMAERELRLTKLEAKLGTMLEAERQRQKVRTWPERLAPPGGGAR